MSRFVIGGTTREDGATAREDGGPLEEGAPTSRVEFTPVSAEVVRTSLRKFDRSSPDRRAASDMLPDVDRRSAPT